MHSLFPATALAESNGDSSVREALERPLAPERAFVSSRSETAIEDGRAWWKEGVLWILRAAGSETGGRSALLEAILPRDFSVSPHHHEVADETFTVLEGTLLFSVGEGDDERVLRADAGDFVWISRGTAHSFRVESASARVLNAYSPAGFEDIIRAGSTPAHLIEAPPPEAPSAKHRALETRFGLSLFPGLHGPLPCKPGDAT